MSIDTSAIIESNSYSWWGKGYGGVVSFLGNNPKTWNPSRLDFGGDNTPYLEYLTGADWTNGPQGRNEFPFKQPAIPDACVIGRLAESFEIVDQYTLIFDLRPRVYYWGNNPKVPGYGREMVAADYIAASERMQSNPSS
ncbi:MAG: hypothetical protein PHE50_10025, partial [Dehalococcoidales bacterium]|nr:hypothetical protein [Dehalococcoidales bacterium]